MPQQHQQQQQIHGSPLDLAQADQWAASILETASRTLERAGRSPDCRSPWEVTMAERTAVKILVKHYGWRVMEPGVLRRVPPPRASVVMDAPITGVPSAAAPAPQVVRRLPA